MSFGSWFKERSKGDESVARRVGRRCDGRTGDRHSSIDARDAADARGPAARLGRGRVRGRPGAQEARRCGCLRCGCSRSLRRWCLLGGTAGAVIGHGRLGPLLERLVGRRAPGLRGRKTAMALPRARRRRVACPRRDATPQPIAPAPVTTTPPRRQSRRRRARSDAARGCRARASRASRSRRLRLLAETDRCWRRWWRSGRITTLRARRYPGSLPCGSSAGRAARRSDGPVDRGRGRA